MFYEMENKSKEFQKSDKCNLKHTNTSIKAFKICSIEMAYCDNNIKHKTQE